MTWTLIFIALVAGEPQAKKIGEYDTMNGCFFARQKLQLQLSGGDEWFPLNTQAICIRTEK